MAQIEMTLGNGLTIIVEGPHVHVEDAIYDQFKLNGTRVSVLRTPSGTPPSPPTGPANLPESGPVAFGTPPLPKGAKLLQLRWLPTMLAFWASVFLIAGLTFAAEMPGAMLGGLLGSLMIAVANGLTEWMEKP
jgi:hypothetical protein